MITIPVSIKNLKNIVWGGEQTKAKMRNCCTLKKKIKLGWKNNANNKMTKSGRQWPEVASRVSTHVMPLIALNLFAALKRNNNTKLGSFQVPPEALSCWSSHINTDFPPTLTNILFTNFQVVLLSTSSCISATSHPFSLYHERIIGDHWLYAFLAEAR